jgi:NitT/TauT family transport system ATP-binding protein
MRQRLRLLPADRPAATMALHAEQLEVVFQVAGKSVTVIERIDFSVAPGELICLLGPSGCGKTTLLSLVAGFLFPSSGSLSVYGRPVTQPGPDRCVVFQEDALFPG